MCEQEMARAAQANAIPLNILYSVGLTETGHKGALNPYDMNVDGRSVHASSLADGLARVAYERAHGAKLIDIGCMQSSRQARFCRLCGRFGGCDLTIDLTQGRKRPALARVRRAALFLGPMLLIFEPGDGPAPLWRWEPLSKSALQAIGVEAFCQWTADHAPR